MTASMKTCAMCGREKPHGEFYQDKRRGRPASRCKPCNLEYSRRWRRARPNYERNRYQATKADARERHLKRKYGVCLADYDAMLRAQGGACAICRRPETDEFHRVLHVDHDHATGRVRGLLCRGCNHMLGVVGDDPMILAKAIQYLVPQVAAEVIGAFMDYERDRAEQELFS